MTQLTDNSSPRPSSIGPHIVVVRTVVSHSCSVAPFSISSCMGWGGKPLDVASQHVPATCSPVCCVRFQSCRQKGLAGTRQYLNTIHKLGRSACWCPHHSSSKRPGLIGTICDGIGFGYCLRAVNHPSVPDRPQSAQICWTKRRFSFATAPFIHQGTRQPIPHHPPAGKGR